MRQAGPLGDPPAQRVERWALEPVAAAGPDDRTGDRVKLRLPAGDDVALHRGSELGVGGLEFGQRSRGVDLGALGVGHGRRGTDSPVMLLRSGTPYFDYFRAQLEWLGLLATQPPKSWTDKGIEVAPVTDELLQRSTRSPSR